MLPSGTCLAAAPQLPSPIHSSTSITTSSRPRPGVSRGSLSRDWRKRTCAKHVQFCLHQRYPVAVQGANESRSVSSTTTDSAVEGSGTSTSTTTDPTVETPHTPSSPAIPSQHFTSYAEHYKQENSLVVPAHNGHAASSSSSHSVDAVLAEAQAALTTAEQSAQQLTTPNPADRLLNIDAPPERQPPSLWMKAFRLVRSLSLLSAMGVAMIASHAFGLYIQLAGAAVGALALGLYGFRTGSLSLSGAVAGAVVGAGSLGCSLRIGMTLILFFLSSSKLTQFKEELKEGLDDQAKKGGQRDWIQVACNAGVPTLLAFLYGLFSGCVDLPLGLSPSLEPWRAQLLTALMGGVLGYYACCCGDTWASELGTLSKETPRLITTLRPVRRGTNGGVTLLGLAASVVGGLFMGLVFYAAGLVAPTLWIFPLQHAVALSQWQLIPLGVFAGLGGSLLDSLLGATVQFTGYNRRLEKITSQPGDDVVHISGMPLLTNNLVNLLSATSMAGLTALLALLLFI